MRRESELHLESKQGDPWKPGTRLKTIRSFSNSERTWGWQYPKLGEVVTLVRAELHHNEDCARRGIYLLHLAGYEHIPTGICDRDVRGVIHFVPCYE